MTCLSPILSHIDASSHVILTSTLCILLARLSLVHLSLRGSRHVFLVVVVHVSVRVGHGCGVRSEHVGDCVNLEGDLSGHNSWKHGHETAGGTKMLTQSSGYRDGRSFVDTVIGETGTGTVFTRGAKRNES